MIACTETERAIFVKTAEEAQRSAQAHERLYVGSETCEKLIPAREDALRILETAERHNRPITILTPACTNWGMARLETLLDLLPAYTEIVFNDWGTFELLRGGQHRPVLGRLLVKISRGFRRFAMAGCAPELVGFLRHSNLDNRELQQFLVENQVHRVELDNVTQGYSFGLDPAIRASLYVPYVYIASGRKCIFSRVATSADAYRSDSGCGFPCRELTFWGLVCNTNERILMSENANYYENHALPDRLSDWNVDRIVDCSLLAGTLATPREESRDGS